MTLIDEALTDCQRLGAVLEDEREAIVGMNAQTIGACTDAKQTITARLEQASRALASKASALDPAALQQLKVTLHLLRRDLARNDAMIQFAHELSRAALGGSSVTTGYDQHGMKTIESESRLRVRV